MRASKLVLPAICFNLSLAGFYPNAPADDQHLSIDTKSSSAGRLFELMRR